MRYLSTLFEVFRRTRGSLALSFALGGRESFSVSWKSSSLGRVRQRTKAPPTERALPPIGPLESTLVFGRRGAVGIYASRRVA